MMNRVSVNVLLKMVVGLMAAAIVVVLAHGAWDSWNRLRDANRMSQVADASTYLFTALHNLRVDRSSSYRDLLAEKGNGLSPMLQTVRAAEMPALRDGLIALQKVDALQGSADVAALGEAVKKLIALHEETTAALSQPKSARRAGIAADALKTMTAVYDLLDKLSDELANSIKLKDAYIDKLIELKQLAWVARNTGGEAHVLVSNAISALPLSADAMQKFAVAIGQSRTAWTMLEEFAHGIALPARFTQAVERAKSTPPSFTPPR